jgi:predicted dehydrogenase
MARAITEADRMIEDCARAGVKLQVAFMKRFNPSFQRAKQIIDEGRVGDVFEMRAVWDNARAATSAQANYRHRVKSGGGFLQEDGSHPLDVCRWWMGEVEEVSARVMVVAANRFENDDVGMVMMRHAGGGLSSLHITMLSHRTGQESYEVFGTRGTLVMRWLYHSTHSIEPAVIELHEKASRVTDLSLSASWNAHDELTQRWQYLNELRHFCACVIEDRPPLVTGADGRAVVEIINAAYVSSHERRSVALPLDRPPDFEATFAALRRSSRWSISDQDAWWSRY